MPEIRSSDRYTVKRLEQLRKQIYGRQESIVKSSEFVAKDKVSSSDITYLRQDLTKIAILSILALGIQFVLYFALKNNLMNLSI